MLHLGAAMKDQAFVQYSSQRYGELIRKLEADEELHKGVPDHDLQDHIDVLEKKDLKSSGWLTIPLDDTEHDFVSKLLNRYLQDLQGRAEAQERLENGFAQNLRKCVQMGDAEELVSEQFHKIAALKGTTNRQE